MRISGGSKSILPLIEIAVAVFFLALSCVIVMNIFLIARSNGRLAQDITEASIRAQSAVEHLKSSDSKSLLDENLSAMFDSDSETGCRGGVLYEVQYDSAWSEVQSDGEYILSLELVGEVRERGVLYSIYVTVVKEKPYPFLDGEDKQKLVDFQNAKYITFTQDS